MYKSRIVFVIFSFTFVFRFYLHVMVKRSSSFFKCQKKKELFEHVFTTVGANVEKRAKPIGDLVCQEVNFGFPYLFGSHQLGFCVIKHMS